MKKYAIKLMVSASVNLDMVEHGVTNASRAIGATLIANNVTAVIPAVLQVFARLMESVHAYLTSLDARATNVALATISTRSV